MTKLKYSINQDMLNSRLMDIENSISRLKELKKEYNKNDFVKDKDAYGIAAYHLQRALEGLLSCGSHILSRIPGAKFDEYATIAEQLAKYDILPASFKETGVKMAKYRNRLVHFYHEVNKEELYTILQKNLKDLEKFHSSLLQFAKNHS